MPVIVNNGKRVGADYRTVINNNGAVFDSSNGKRLSSLNRWGNMTWDGHHFAPPDSGSVLYFPGIPGVGTTITDFSHSFSDSGINTAEELDASETAIDVSADPTSAYSTGDVIRIDDELMYVTSSAEPTLVIRGYEGSHAATHSNPSDIYVRTKNDGTITGAIWKQRPTGLWYLDFDGTDDGVTATSSFGDINFKGQTFTVEFWIESDDVGNYMDLIGIKPATGTNHGIQIFQMNDGVINVVFVRADGDSTGLTRTDTDIALVVDTPTHVGITFNGGGSPGSTSIEIVINGVNTTEGVGGGISQNWSALADNTVFITDFGSFNYNGAMALHRISDVELTVAQIANHYNQERHLFGV